MRSVPISSLCPTELPSLPPLTFAQAAPAPEMPSPRKGAFPGKVSSDNREPFPAFSVAAMPFLQPKSHTSPSQPLLPGPAPSRPRFLDGPLCPEPCLSGCWSPTQGSKGVPQVLLVDEAIPVLVHDGEGLAETRALKSHPPTHPSPASLPGSHPSPPESVGLHTAARSPSVQSLGLPGCPAQQDTSMAVTTDQR